MSTSNVIHADCLTALRDMPDASVDAVVTDPPYGLSNTTPAQVAETITRWVSGDREYLPASPRKGKANCLTHLIRRGEGDAMHPNALAVEDRVNLPVALGFGASAMIRAVEFEHDATLGEVEVNDVGAPLTLDDVLVDDLLSGCGEVGEKVEFRLGAAKRGPACVGECPCFRELSQRRVTVDVRLGYYSQTESQRARGVVALRATELRAVLAFDAARGAFELAFADGAPEGGAVLLLVTPKAVGACPAARGLAAVAESGLVGEVDSVTDGAVSVDLVSHAGLLDRFSRPNNTPVGFMGKEWDSFVPIDGAAS